MSLETLQKKLKKQKLDAFVVPHNNLFLGQDILDEENLILQLSGFSGSAGMLTVTPEKSYLLVDGRYELQAPQQTAGKNIETVCLRPYTPTAWLNQHFAGQKVGYNPWCLSAAQTAKLTEPKLIADSELLPLSLSDRNATLFEHKIEYCGQSAAQKIAQLCQWLQQKNLDSVFVSAADSVSWLFNLRSDALPETPIFRGFAIVEQSGRFHLFADNIDTSKLGFNLKIHTLSDIEKYLKKYKKQTMAFDFNVTPAAIIALAEQNKIAICCQPDFCQTLKAVKNDCELQGIRQAHIRDGIAVCKFLHWLDSNWHGKTELDIVAKLHDFRGRQPLFVSESFATIAAYGSNGAIVHYSPTPQTNAELTGDSLLLLDSGGQYLDGTTDITRTIALGSPSVAMINDFTLVLKSHITLSCTVFPEATIGGRLDAIARRPLWLEGKDYNHGTGHGVGCFLNVHEGPVSISTAADKPLCLHTVTSIEPGYYLEGQYGIRIENLVEVCATEQSNFLRFQNLTMVPIDKRAINKYLLSESEIAWLNSYHQTVFETISPHLTVAEKQWLSEACAPL